MPRRGTGHAHALRRQPDTPSNVLIGTVTARMPAIIRPEHWGTWLGETDASLAEIKALPVP